ncbi:TonB-dependent siderophore receptor [Acinetobacter sp. WZC-1]|uniref:TonB-dependent siderophore receptor n=1 Tax=Acinetobacter sp. WZC-1 TaxID=3459034 RepID=UPI00403D807D
MMLWHVKRHKIFKLTALAGMLPVLGGAPVFAADESAVQESASRELPTIIVQATPLNSTRVVNAGGFGAKDPMEIPIAIQSYNAEDIRDQAARTVQDILNKDASISGASYGGAFDNFRLRGFIMDNFNTIRRDGLTLAAHHDVGLENIERVDVLKGPSGFLYGINSPGGTVNYILKRPTLDPFTSVTVQGSSRQQGYIAVDSSNSTKDERFGYRLNAAYEKKGDFDHAGDLERKMIGLATDFRLTDQTLLQLNADWSEKSVISDPLLRADQSGRADPLDPASYIRPPKVDRRDLLSPSWYRHKTEGLNADARLQIDLNDDWQSVTQANYSRAERHGGYNDLYNIQPNGDIGSAGYYQSRGEVFTAYTLQSYLAGKLNTGVVKHDVFLGAAFKRQGDRSPYWDDKASTSASDVGLYSVGNILNPVQPPRYDFGAKQAIRYNGHMTESSVFASDLMTFNDYIQLLLGGRYVWYKARDLDVDYPPHDQNNFIPSASLMFRPTENVMTYVSYTKGIERGMNAPSSTLNADQPTGLLKSEQYEVGLKANLTPKLNLGIAAFNITRDALYTNLDNYYVKTGEFRHRGIEAELKGRPTEYLQVLANVAYLDTELRKVQDQDTLGKRNEGVPKWKSYVGASYSIPQLPELSVDGSVSYVSNRAVDAQNSGFIPSYTLVDAGLKYNTYIQKTPVTFRVLGKNLLNKYYYSSVYEGGLAVGQSREVVFSAQFQF